MIYISLTTEIALVAMALAIATLSLGFYLEEENFFSSKKETDEKK